MTLSTVYRFNNGTATLQASVTNFESDDLPGGFVPVFHRGDANDTSLVDLTDGVFILNFLFSGGPVPPCLDAADSDDNGTIVLTDAVYVLNFLFSQGPPPPAPGPSGSPCGEDPTVDAREDLGCVDYEGC